MNMRKTVLILLAVALAMPAVEWNIEQVTNVVDSEYRLDPALVLDSDGNATVLYRRGTASTEDTSTLMVASNKTGSWQFEDVARAWGSWVIHSLDVDADGNIYAAYQCLMLDTATDIFLATNKDGSFSAVNLTEDPSYQFKPVLKLDRQGVPHIIFNQGANLDAEFQLWYGWVTAEGFEKEQVTDDIYQDYDAGYDLVFDQLNRPHIFYIGADNYLWHATQDASLAWQSEIINHLFSEAPSAAVDQAGALYVAYDVEGMNIHYATNREGQWQYGQVTKGMPPGSANYFASIALDRTSGYNALGNPHVAWHCDDSDSNGDLWFASKQGDDWVKGAVTTDPGYEWGGYGHYFAVDPQGYGNITYCRYDSNEKTQIFFAKSTEPLTEGISESQPVTRPGLLEVRGTAVRFTLAQLSLVNLSLYDAAGQRVQEIAFGFYSSGQNEVSINLDNLSAGVYFVRLQTDNSSANARMVVIR